MKAQELRIGNWIYLDCLNYDLTDTVKKAIAVKPPIIRDLFNNQMDTVSPIPLTPEWLERFGFKREDKTPPSKEHSQYFSMWVMDYKYSFSYAPFREDWGFYHSYTDAPKDEDNDRFDFISCGIKYVHQLQNLYFCLTGQELELK